MSQVTSDLNIWITDAVSWQISEVSTSQLQGDGTALLNDLAKCEADAQSAAK
jgi:hypothetical protein